MATIAGNRTLVLASQLGRCFVSVLYTIDITFIS